MSVALEFSSEVPAVMKDSSDPDLVDIGDVQNDGASLECKASHSRTEVVALRATVRKVSEACAGVKDAVAVGPGRLFVRPIGDLIVDGG